MAMAGVPRRKLLAGLGAAVVVLSVPGTATAGRSVPRGAVTHLSIKALEGRVRTRTASGWSNWRPLRSCRGGRTGASPTTLISLDPGVVEYELDVPRSAVITELDTTRAAVTAAPVPEFVLGDVLVRQPYLSRAAWGADESWRFTQDGTERYPAAYFPVQTLTVHHTAMAVGRDPAADLRAIYHNQAVNLDYGDVGYHLLIDPGGQVYEGRWSGQDLMPVFGPVREQGRLLMSNAAHVGGFNAGNVGVCLLGDFTNAPPRTRAVDALVAVLAALATTCRLDPLGRTNYVNPISGSTATVDTISGHRAWQPTDCPGNRWFPDLPAVRARVARRMA